MAGEPITLGEFKTALGELKRQGRLHQGMSAEDALGSITGYIEAARRPLNVAERAGAAVTTASSKAVEGIASLAGGILNFGGKMLGSAAESMLVGDGGETGEDYSPGFEEGSVSGSIDQLVGGAVKAGEAAVASAAPPAPVSVMDQPTSALGKAGHYLETEAPKVAAQAAGLVAMGPAAGASVGSMSFGGQSWRAAKDAGATDEQAAMALAIGAGGGALQAGLLGKIALRSPGMIPTLVNATTLAASNLGIEAAQDEWARHTYDPERDVLAGWKENLAGSAIGVIVAGGLGRTLRDPAARSEADTPVEDTKPAPGETPRAAPEGPKPAVVEAVKEAGAPIDLTGEGPPVAIQMQEIGPLRIGKPTEIVLPDQRSLPAHYAIIEADDLVPSHDARKGFRKNPNGDANERPYDDPTEGKPYRATVEKIAEKPNMGLLLTDTPTAVDGPPVVTKEGVVLGGNARTMASQLVYARGKAEAETMRAAVRARAAAFGLDAEGIENPVLVRMVTPGLEGEPGSLSRALNAAMTTGRTPLSDAVSRGSKVSKESAAAIAGIIDESTIREALGDPLKSRAILRELMGTRAISDTDAVTMIDTRGLPTQAARDVIEHTLLGAVVPDVRALAEAQASTKNVLIRALPHLLTMEAAWPGFKEHLRTALDGLSSIRQSKLSVDDALAQTTIMPEPWKTDPIAVSMVRAFESDSPTSMTRRFQNIAEAASDIAAGQAQMFFDPADRTVQRMFQLNMPEPGIKVSAEQLAVLAPVEVKSPGAIAEPTPSLAQTAPEEVPRLARELKVPVEDVANARPPAASPEQAELPLTGTASDVGSIVTRWFNRRHEETTWANAKAQTNWEQLKAIVGRRSLGEYLKQAVGHEEIEKRAQAAAYAMAHWIELGGELLTEEGVKHVSAMVASLTDAEFARDVVAVRDAMNLSPELRAMADRLRTENLTEGQLYQDRDLIISAKKAYTAHLWKDGAESPAKPDGPPKGVNPKWGATRARQLQRTFPTILDGLVEMQRRKLAGEPYSVLAIRSAIEQQRLTREQMGTLTVDRNLMETGLKSGIFSNVHHEGFEPINALNFKKWLVAGRLKGEVFEPMQKEALFAGLDQPNIKPAQVEAWGPNAFVSEDGQTLFVKQQLYAEADTAKRLNNALGKSALSDIKGFDVTMKYLEAARGQMLAYDFSQHFTIPFRAMMGMQGMAALNPLGASKTGRAAIMAQTPDVGLLVRNNLRIGTIQDFVELQKQQQTVIGETIDKLPVAREGKAFAETFRAWQEDWLYRRLIPGLKVQHGLLELGRLRQKYAESLASGKMSQDEVARMAAESSNDLFGGQNLVSRNRNPTTQGIFRLIDIAPDWRESSIRMGAKAFQPGGEVYQRMWLRAMVRGFVATSLWNTMMAGVAQDGEDEKRTFWDRQSGYWHSGRLPMFELDVTPAYRALGGTSDAHKYISILGKMDELYKLTGPQALQFGRQRLGIVPKVLVDGLSGSTPWGQGFTDVDQLLGTDDRGIYTQLRVHANGKINIPGMEKGRDLSGKMTATGLDTRAVDVTRLPSFISYEATGILPAPVQNTMLYLTGQMSAMDSLVRGWGVPMQTEIRPKVKK